MSGTLIAESTVTGDRDERARRAASAFRSLQPTLSAYARILTGRRDVKVEMSATSNGHTDGRRIFFRPPIALGDRTPHQRNLCDRRDINKLHRCPACAIREQVLVTIYHEIAHLVYDSFRPVSDADRDAIIKHAISERGTKYAKEIEAQVGRGNAYHVDARAINPFMGLIINALEDGRIETATFEARPGTRVMFEGQMYKTLNEGVECKVGDDVETKFWKDQPLNSQMTVGLYFKAGGYAYEGCFSPEVETALSDDIIADLCDKAAHAKDAGGVFAAAFPIVARARQYGFFKNPNEPEDEPDPEPLKESEPDENTDSSGDDPKDQDAKPGDSSGGEPESGDAGTGGDSDPDDSDAPSGERGDTDESPSPEESNTDSDGGDPADGERDSEERSDEGTPEQSAQDDGEEGDDLNEEGTPDGPSDEAGNPTDEGGGEGTGAEPEEDGTSSDGGMHSQGSAAPGDGGVSGDEESDRPDTESSEAGDSGDARELDPDEAIDTGADDGLGGTQIDKTPDFGDAEDAEAVLVSVLGHEERPETMEVKADEKATDVAIIQGMYFETPAVGIVGVCEHFYGEEPKKSNTAWSGGVYRNITARNYGTEIDDIVPSESMIGDAVKKMRLAFSENKRANDQRNLKSGKVSGRVLGKRAPMDDERLFKKHRLPGKRDYFVGIMMDVSGSTAGKNIDLMKRSVYAQATILHRLGVDFAIYAHSGTKSILNDEYNGNSYQSKADQLWGEDAPYLDLDVYVIKAPKQPWDKKAKAALDELGPVAANLDGHALEYVRRITEAQHVTDRVVLYYSDGKMPAANHDEELEVLQREIKTCAQKRISLLGIGIRTDSPAKHGLPTVQVDEVSDVTRVVGQLKQAILKNRS